MRAENGELLEEITVDAKKQGAIHHGFAAGEGQMVVIDEWDTAEHFNGFFGCHSGVAKVTNDRGVQGPPTVQVFEKGETRGTF